MLLEPGQLFVDLGGFFTLIFVVAGQWFRGTVALAVEDDPVGIVAQAVDGRCSEQAIVKGLAPLGEIEISGDQDSCIFMTFSD